ncbi:phosphonoacetaldehyde reductase [Planktomarina temperata]|nr:phosphonoacetaldehyde reductase [Planktomarina temperata]
MTQTLTGIGALSRLSEIRAQFKAEKVMLVTGKSSYSASGAKSIVDTALQNDTLVQFSDFDVNPKIEDAERGVALAIEAGIDLIVGVGGGSVMDMAKLIKAFYSAPDKTKELARGELTMTDPGIPMILVPTTAGSGSEATHFAVVYLGLDKYSLASQLLLPNAVILDGSLIASATHYQKACNGLDALAQAIESAWAVGSTEQSREYSFRAVSLCAEYLKEVLVADATSDALQGMMEAANLAGKAINISKTTAAHAWSYAITSHYNVPHGHAVWLTLPKIFEIHASSSVDVVTDLRGIEHFRAVMTRLMDILGIGTATDSAQHLKSYLHEISVESDMSSMGADTTDMREFLSKQVNMQRMSNNPVTLSETNIQQIFML